MATINKGEVIQKFIDGLRLDAIREKVPNTTADKILPVFSINNNPLIPDDIFDIHAFFTSVAVPVSEQIYTIPSGYTLYLTSVAVGSGTSNAVLTLSDGIADGGTAKFVARLGANGVYSYYPSPSYMKLINGIRFDAGNQTASVQYTYNITGFLVKNA